MLRNLKHEQMVSHGLRGHWLSDNIVPPWFHKPHKLYPLNSERYR